jgi:hypothetical protein
MAKDEEERSMNLMEALTKLVFGMSRLGDHLLRQKVSGIIVAALAFACGAGLVYELRRAPRTTYAVVAEAQPADPARAEVSIRDTNADENEEESAVFDKGHYANYVYGYSIKIPDGMVGLGSPPPAPQHGFGIDLDNPRSTEWIHGPEFPKSYVYVDGSYNSIEWKRPDEAVNSHLRFLREQGRNVRLQRRVEMLLGGLTALRVVALYEQDGVEMMSDETVAFRVENDGEVSAVYSISLSTPRSKYERDRPVLEELLQSWCLQPIE